MSNDISSNNINLNVLEKTEERAERIYNALNVRVCSITLTNWYKRVSSSFSKIAPT